MNYKTGYNIRCMGETIHCRTFQAAIKRAEKLPGSRVFDCEDGELVWREDIHTTPAESRYEITTAPKTNYSKKTTHQYSNAKEVHKALGAFQDDPDTYIWHWQAGAPHTDYERVQEAHR